MIRIIFKSPRFRNANHGWFHGRVYDLVTETQAYTSALRVPSYLMEEWKKWIDIEADLCNESRASILTSEMRVLDRRRASLFLLINSHVKDYLKSENSDEEKAATRLKLLLKSYKGVNRAKQNARMQVYAGLMIDLAKPEYVSCIETLQLQAKVETLQTCINAYVDLYNQRVEFYKNRRLFSMEMARPKADGCLDLVRTVVESAFICGETAEEKEIVNELILRINEHAIQILASMGESTSSKNNDDVIGDTTPVVPQTNEDENETTVDEPSSPSTPAEGENGNSGNQGNQGSESDQDHQGSQDSEGGQTTPPDTGGFMG